MGRQNKMLLAVAVSVVVATYLLIAFTPLRSTIPGYPDARSRKLALENAIKMDSLENAMMRWELYAGNLSRILSGEKTIRHDSILRSNALDLLSDKSPEYLNMRDSLLREQVQESERFQLSSTIRELPVEGMHFFSPLKGIVVEDFNEADHPAVHISAPESSVACSVYQGTVVCTGWDSDAGHIIVVQHPNNVLSTYENCEKALVKTGDQVKAGTPLALVGVLHFSLWSKGEPINPGKYINL